MMRYFSWSLLMTLRVFLEPTPTTAWMSFWSSQTTTMMTEVSNRRSHCSSQRRDTFVLEMSRQKKQGGFGQPSKADEKRETSSSEESNPSIYSLPALYDLAFGYRDYEAEVDFLLDYCYKPFVKVGRNLDILELAAGPGRHALTALQLYHRHEVDEELPHVSSVCCIDTSSEMATYARTLAQEHLPYDLWQSLDDKDDDDVDFAKDRKHARYRYQLADMRNFSQQVTGATTETFDTVWILLGSLQHLLTNDDVTQCFQSIQKVLRPSGTVVVELPHPKETCFGSTVACTKNSWQVPLEDDSEEECGQLSILWGDEDDDFDPIKQIRQFTVGFDLTGKISQELESGSETIPSHIRQIVPMRIFTAQEIDALARGVGLRVIAMYGALEEDVDVHDEDTAYRMVCVLQQLP